MTGLDGYSTLPNYILGITERSGRSAASTSFAVGMRRPA
jgi:hypothetical protein